MADEEAKIYLQYIKKHSIFFSSIHQTINLENLDVVLFEESKSFKFFTIYICLHVFKVLHSAKLDLVQNFSRKKIALYRTNFPSTSS